MPFVLSAYPKNRSHRSRNAGEADKPAIWRSAPVVGRSSVQITGAAWNAGPGALSGSCCARRRAHSVKLLIYILFLGALVPANAGAASVPANILGWSTNGPAVYALVSAPATNSATSIQTPNADQSAQ